MAEDDFMNNFFGRPRGKDNRFSSDNSAGTQDFNNHGFNGGADGSFDIFHNVMIQMHINFGRQLNELFNEFLTPGFNDSTIESGGPSANNQNTDPRDFYLKPEYKQRKVEEQNTQEGYGDSNWFGRVLPAPSDPPNTQTYSWFRSVTRKSVTLPDGTVKTEEIIKNSDGTEQITESETLPDVGWAPVLKPVFPDYFNYTNVPKIHKYDFLKPGYENFNPNSEKVDMDLDRELLNSGIEDIPDFPKIFEGSEQLQGPTVKSFVRRIVINPDGVVKSEEIVQNSDGTEQKRITETVQIQSGNSGKTSDNFSALSFAVKGIKDILGMIFK